MLRLTTEKIGDFVLQKIKKKKFKKNIVLMINLEYLLIHHLIKMEI